MTPSTSRAIGMATPYESANSMTTLTALTPSATWFIDAMISSIGLPAPSCSPTWGVGLGRLGARADRTTHAGSPAEGAAVPTRRLAELGHLAHRPGHHHGAGVFADANRVAHTHRDRVDVLQRACHLDANHIVGGVRPKSLGAK